MSVRSIGRWCPLLVLLASAGGLVRAQGFTDYTRRIPVTIHNGDTAATPSPTSAEVTIPLDTANMRSDRLDVRVGYNNGTTIQEIDSKVFRQLATASPFYTENASAGTTSYATLASSFPGSVVTTGSNAGDDSGALLTLPFNFPFAGGSSNQIFMSIDGYLVPGSAQPTSEYGLTTGGGVRGIFPYASDYTTVAFSPGATAANIYYYSDPTQAIFRWEVAQTGQSTVIAKFAAILKPDGSIRFVYSDLVTPTSAGTGDAGSYAVMAYGVQVGYFGGGIIHYPVDNFPTSATFSNHADILYTPTGAALPAELARAVFRLQQPIPAGGDSTGQYYVYYGAVSPTNNPAREVRNVFDHTVDFLSAANVIGQAPPDWDVQVGNQISVQTYQGGKVGVLNTVVASNHPRATVKASAMPAFLNPEILAHVAPDGGGSLEMAPMARVVANSGDPNFQGGYAYAVDAFGDPGGSHVVSYINPVTSADPADMGGVPDPQKADVYCNILYRVTGDPGIIQGKNWRDDQTEPAGLELQVDRAQIIPKHGAVEDPIYNQPGTTGMSSYAQRIAIDYIALRELRNLTATSAAPETLTPAGPFIQGTVTDNATGAPLSSAIVTITNGGTFTQSYAVSATGTFKVTVPAGTYSVSALAPCYETKTTAGVGPTASGTTNFALVFGCGTLTGVCRAGINNQLQPNTIVTLIDGTGKYVTSTTSDANGFYSLTYPSGGTFGLGAMSPLGYGARVSVTLPSGGTAVQNLTMSVLANGDCEIPNSTNSFALGWTTSFDTPGAYLYTQDQNHTPGGHWSMAIKDPSSPDGPNHLSGLNNPPQASFNLPVQSDLFDITVSVWVYLTKTGQLCALRLRDNWPLQGGKNLVFAKAGALPDPNNMNTGGLDGDGHVPINQWYEIRVSVPAGTALKSEAPTRLQMNLYGMNANYNPNWQGYTGGTDGTIYFDDWTVTQGVKASALGKAVDDSGQPVANAYVGKFTDAGGLAGQNLFTGPFTYSDDAGNFTVYSAAPGDVPVGVWGNVVPNAAGTLPLFGSLLGTATLTTAASPGARTSVTAKKVGVVSIGATGSAGGQNDADVAKTTDNKINTRWASVGSVQDVTLTYDLGSAKSIDQIELFWEAAVPDVYDVAVGTSLGTMTDVMNVSANCGALGISGWPYTNGPVHLIRLPTSTSARYITVHMNGFTGSLLNYSLYEIRALSAAAPLPYSSTDVMRALQIAGGLATASAADKTRLDKDGDGKITLLDAAKINKSVNGL